MCISQTVYISFLWFGPLIFIVVHNKVKTINILTFDFLCVDFVQWDMGLDVVYKDVHVERFFKNILGMSPGKDYITAPL